MSKFEKGVRCYTSGELRFAVHFPEGEVICRWCPYIRYEEHYKRYSCRITGRWVFDPMNNIGEHCPVEFNTLVY
jgi:hypothetical protein